MNRRDLIKFAAVSTLAAGTMAAGTGKRTKLIKPKRLAPGDAVGLIAPASGVPAETWDRAIANLRLLGLNPEVGKYARGRRGFLSGTDAERLSDLHWAFGEPRIKAVWCVRGGGGAPRLLPDVDYGLIKKNSKVFIGFSDITALHLAIHQQTGLVTFHGPVGASDQTEYTRKHLENVLMRPTAPYAVDVSPVNAAKESAFYKTETVNRGKARGRLVGGNLSLLASLAGTPYALKDTKGKIIFIEEINEPPYRIDRMLTQLRQSCDLGAAAGFALGVFDDNSIATPTDAKPVLDVIRDRLGDLGRPLVYGLSFGHIKDNMTLPYGVEAELDASSAKLTLLEDAVI